MKPEMRSVNGQRGDNIQMTNRPGGRTENRKRNGNNHEMGKKRKKMSINALQRNVYAVQFGRYRRQSNIPRSQ